MKKKINRLQPTVSLQIISSDEQKYQQKYQNSYEQQPTIMFLSKRQSFGIKKKHQSQQIKQLKPKFTKMLQNQSDLLQSSDNQTSHLTNKQQEDGQFICKYLTPIKKQDNFNVKLFIQDDNNKNKKTNKLKQPNQRLNTQQYIQTNQKANYKVQNQIDLFKPQFSVYQEPNKKYNQPVNTQICSNCQNKFNKAQLSLNVFQNNQTQINFLKSNNRKLYDDLIEKNKKILQLQNKLRFISYEYQKLKEKSQLQKQKVSKLNIIVSKMSSQRRQIIQREWKQFNFLKEYLNQKQKSKSKDKPIQRLSKQPRLQLKQQKISNNNFIQWKPVQKIIEKDNSQFLLKQSKQSKTSLPNYEIQNILAQKINKKIWHI